MAENSNTSLTIEAWAEITIKEWVKKSEALGINDGSGLAASRFVHHITGNANGDPEKIQFAFDYFLNFVDWGVGRGVSLEHRDLLISSGATTRRQKRWFTSVFYQQVKILSNILAEKYALKAAHLIINTSTYDAEGTKLDAPSENRSGTYTAIDKVSGNKKITFKQFNENRKKAGW
jgi:hypothetical protein